MFKSKDLLYHSIAILTVIIWGTTFVSTKILINTGLSPVEILLYRFVLAYFCILTIAHRRLWANCVKDEFLLFLSGLCGGSLYFIAENTALGITLASNVSLLICTAPIITTVLSHLFYKESLRKGLLYGSLVAATMWAFYCLILKRLSRSYPTLFITRKVFFYGILSLFFYFAIYPLNIKLELLKLPIVYLNILFLGVIASMLCYIMWNTAVRALGASKTANYIYIVPLVTLITSAIFLSETITIASGIGALAIISGVYIAER